MPTATTDRPKTMLHALSDTGREFGIAFTDGDVQRVAQVARWRCLSAHHLARYELSKEHWHPAYIGSGGGAPTDDYAARAYSIRRRLSKLTRITSNPGMHVGPPVKSVMLTHKRIGWCATRYGLTLAQVPWSIRHIDVSGSVAIAHAWLAADIGWQVEALGVRVLSEREVARAEDFRGNAITASLASAGKSTTGADVSKRPDVVALAPNGIDYIAIEVVERWDDRALGTYAKKLAAYERNPSIHRVWYACRSEATARRVERAAIDAGVDPGWLRIRVVSDVNGLWGLDDLDQRTLPTWSEPKLLRDLDELRAMG